MAAWGRGPQPLSGEALVHMTSLVLLLLLLVFYCPAQPYPGVVAYPEVYTQVYNTTSCLNGDTADDSSCICHSCWAGEFCQRYEDHYAPRFLVHAATAVVAENITGPVYRAWATDDDLGLTCPWGPGDSTDCPCATVTYQLFAAPGDHHFSLHQTTGILSRNISGAPLIPGETHTYKLMVQSLPKRERIQDLQYDILDLKIYVSPDFVTIIPCS